MNGSANIYGVTTKPNQIICFGRGNGFKRLERGFLNEFQYYSLIHVEITDKNRVMDSDCGLNLN